MKEENWLASTWQISSRQFVSAAKSCGASRRRCTPYTDQLCPTPSLWRSLEGNRCEPEVVFVHISARTQGVAGINVQAVPGHQVPEATRSF
jgi:hypothetical protein